METEHKVRRIARNAERTDDHFRFLYFDDLLFIPDEFIRLYTVTHYFPACLNIGQ